VCIGTPGNEEGEEVARLEIGSVYAVEECVDSGK
jgi:hypothetical protein